MPETYNPQEIFGIHQKYWNWAALGGAVLAIWYMMTHR